MRRGWAALCLVAISVGCQEFLTIVAEDQHSLQPVFSFHSESIFGLGGPQAVRVSSFRVSASDGGNDAVVWEIESPAAKITAEPTAKPAPLKQITYGDAPAGYATVIAAHPLAPGKTYQITSSIKVEGDEAVVGAAGEFTPTKP